MREIKFRAWDLEQHCWIGDIGTTFTSADISEGQVGLSLDGHLRVFQANHYNEIRDSETNSIIEPCSVAVSNSEYESIHPVDTNPTYKRQYELMQFTGLKDKNGVEVFESDLVRFTDNGVEREGEIVGDIWNMTVNYPGGGISLEELALRIKEFEVIGNIYENPELLKSN